MPPSVSLKAQVAGAEVNLGAVGNAEEKATPHISSSNRGVVALLYQLPILFKLQQR